ncbi:MAG: SRPBCC domain-containing protein [Phycisphaeraceae bacterium]|nr:SRPBCC domain-containing protein [Phycisphaeraceae bacterium]
MMTQVAASYAWTYPVGAEAARVWSALLDEAALREWFAERVRVEARVGGAFGFGGKYTPRFGGPEPSGQRITALEPGRRLGFEWVWAGVPTRVELVIEDKGGACAVRVSHEFEGALPGFDAEITRWLAQDFWDVAMANLKSFVRKGRAAIRPDHEAVGERVELSIEIEAPAARVWRALVEPEQMGRWLARADDMPVSPRVDLRIGGEYSFGWERDGESMGPREILELEPGRRLVYSWSHKGDATNRTEWRVDAVSAGKTRLTVVQMNIGSAREFSGYANGWASYLVAIERAVGE